MLPRAKNPSQERHVKRGTSGRVGPKTPLFYNYQKLLKNFAAVYRQFKRGSQNLCGFAAKHHAFQEDFEVIEHGADVLVNLQIERDDGFVLGNLQLRFRHGIIDAVVDIEGGLILLAHSAPPHVGFVGDDERRRYHVLRIPRGFIMVADGGNYGDPVFNGHVRVLQQVVGQKCPVLRMMGPVNRIPDVVHVPGDFRQLDFLLGVAEPLQDFSRLLSYLHAVGLRVIRKTQLSQVGVSLLQICVDFLVLPDVLIFQMRLLLFIICGAFRWLISEVLASGGLLPVDCFRTIIVAFPELPCYPIWLMFISNRCKTVKIQNKVIGAKPNGLVRN